MPDKKAKGVEKLNDLFKNSIKSLCENKVIIKLLPYLLS
jgi:hypothetical protein